MTKNKCVNSSDHPPGAQLNILNYQKYTCFRPSLVPRGKMIGKIHVWITGKCDKGSQVLNSNLSHKNFI